MKNAFIVLLLIFYSEYIYAQKESIDFQFIKIDRNINAIGLSLFTVKVTNNSTDTVIFGGPNLLHFHAKVTPSGTWSEFSAANFYINGRKKMLMPRESFLIENINLNIFQAACRHPELLGDILYKEKEIYFKISTFSYTRKNLVYSDSVLIKTSPLNDIDRLTLQSIREQGINPIIFTGKEHIISTEDVTFTHVIEKHKYSIFADLARIQSVLNCLMRDPISYTPERHALNKRLLSEIRHADEFDYLKYWVKVAQEKLAEAEKKGF